MLRLRRKSSPTTRCSGGIGRRRIACFPPQKIVQRGAQFCSVAMQATRGLRGRSMMMMVQGTLVVEAAPGWAVLVRQDQRRRSSRAAATSTSLRRPARPPLRRRFCAAMSLSFHRLPLHMRGGRNYEALFLSLTFYIRIIRCHSVCRQDVRLLIPIVEIAAVHAVRE